MDDTAELRRQLFARDEGPHQGRRFLGADEGRSVRLWLGLQDRRRAAALLPHAARRRRRGRHPRRRSSKAKASPISGSATSTTRRTTASCCGPTTTRARSSTRWSSATSTAAPISTTGSPTPAARASGAPTMTASSTPGSTPTIARRRSSTTVLGTTAREDRLVYEEADPGFFMSVGGTPLERLDLHRHQRPRDVGIPGHAGQRSRAPSRNSSRRARPGWNTTSRKAATSSSS